MNEIQPDRAIDRYEHAVFTVFNNYLEVKKGVEC